MMGTDKLWVDLGGRPLLARTISAFQECPDVERIVVVASERQMARVRKLCLAQGFTRVVGVCSGGASRQASVLLGLLALGECDLVAVHDGARPLVTSALISAGYAAAREKGAAVCAVPAKNTVKVVSAEGLVLDTPDRAALWEAQTPQIFPYAELLAAHHRAAESELEYTDDAGLMEAAGIPVWVFEGSYANLKVTTPEDLLTARALHGVIA